MKYMRILLILFLIILEACGRSDTTDKTEPVKSDTLASEAIKQSEKSGETSNEAPAASNKSGYTKVLRSKNGNSTSVLKLRGPDTRGELAFFISVHAGKCSGEMKGIATRSKNSNSKYLYKGSNCRLEIELSNDRAEVTQYGCKKHVGMFCGFSGTYKK